ncbi:hypothetical protein HYV81_01325 [Candidatus Woesearchaeota archaeon]|nr:hypothetical protein [Candidatus Woesearchaeota archaeon]
MTDKRIIVLLLSFLLLTTIAYAKSKQFNPKMDDWYKVEQWELDICSKWGGTEAAQAGAQLSQPIYLSVLTLTLQGEKIEQPDNTSLFKVTWYIEPAASSVSYKVELVGNSPISPWSVQEASTATNSNPGVGFYAKYFNITEQLTHVVLTYSNNQYVKVPVIKVEG